MWVLCGAGASPASIRMRVGRRRGSIYVRIQFGREWCPVPKTIVGCGRMPSESAELARARRSRHITRHIPLLDFQHAVERDPCPVLHVIFHFDLVDDVSFDQILERPAEMLRGDAEHSCAQAAGVVEGDYLLA